MLSLASFFLVSDVFHREVGDENPKPDQTEDGADVGGERTADAVKFRNVHERAVVVHEHLGRVVAEVVSHLRLPSVANEEGVSIPRPSFGNARDADDQSRE